jgi:hypothetical protein
LDRTALTARIATGGERLRRRCQRRHQVVAAQEVHSDAARRLLTATHLYPAPDLLFPELGNVIRKKVRRGELSAENGHRLAGDLTTVPVETFSSRVLMSDAVALAPATGTAAGIACFCAPNRGHRYGCGLLACAFCATVGGGTKMVSSLDGRLVPHAFCARTRT